MNEFRLPAPTPGAGAVMTTRNGSKKLADESADTELQKDDTAAAAAAAAAVPSAAASAAATPVAATSAAPAGGTPTLKAGRGNKKPKYPCGKCDTEVTCGIACNSCELWYHDKCVEGMTKEFFDNCKKAVDIWGYSGFLCKVCRKVFTILNKALKDVKSELREVKNQVTVLELEKEALDKIGED